MLLSILQQEQPDKLLFCFDEGEDTFRHQENETYKEGRAETPDEFFVQIPRVMQLIEAFQLKRISDGKYEADDYLCTYAKAAEKEGMRVTIVTGDRDAFQLATENIRVSIPHKGYQKAEYLGPKEIEEKYGIRPDQVPAYKGLCGDSSDNLPGVKGIGPKTAAGLIQKYGSLQGIYDHLGEIKGSVKDKLEKDRESAFFCERMAQLVCDIPLTVSLEDLSVKGIKAEPIVDFMNEMTFSLLQRRFQSFLTTEYGKTHFLSAPVPAKPTQDQLTLFSA